MQPQSHLCERARSWASLRADGELSDLESALLDSHLGRCSSCRTFARDTEEIAAMLRAARLETPAPFAPRLRQARRTGLRALQVAAAVAVVDPDTAAVQALWSVSCPGPHGLDLDRAGGRVFVACDGGEVICLSSVDGREVGKVPIAGVPDAIWFNQAASSLYVAIAQPGVLQVVDTNQIAIAGVIKTELGAQTTAFDVRRQDLYVFKPNSCAVAAFHID